MKLFQAVLFILFNLSSINAVKAQYQETDAICTDSLERKSVTMPAGIQFAASPWKEMWWGKHWRDEWTTPVSFPILNMDTMDGGLAPLKVGGGHQTKTLRLLGKNGKEYVLRTIDKSLDVLIPEEFKGSFFDDIVNDQISTAHPYGPLVVSHLSESVGILHTNPIIVFVPNNSRLGEFKNDFANKLCLFEERSSGEGWDHTATTGFADDIINSEKLFLKLSADNKRSVDQMEFLKVRFLDMLINDWDRHEDQWVWTEHKKNDKIVYQPFARDRDQSFSKTDGIYLYFLSRSWSLRSVQNMSPDVSDVIGTNLSATSLDKKFTNELSDVKWRQTIMNLQQLLTDSVILEALHQMPQDVYKLSGDWLYKRLRQRRDNMMKFGMHYYEVLNREVTITGTDQQEIFIINKLNKNLTTITIHALNKAGGMGDIIFYREFDHDITKEINLYGLGGNDSFIYKGNAGNRILLRVIGGEGRDSYAENTVAKSIGKKSIIYDSPSDTPAISDAYRYNATTDTSLTNYKRKGFDYDWWVPLIYPGYNPDDGVLIGGAFTYKKLKWNKSPFGWQQSIGGNYAVATGAFSLFYKGLFKQAFGKWDLNIDASYFAPTFVLNFYGYGNNTKLLTDQKSFYRARAKSIYFNPAVSYSWTNNTFKTGLIFNTVKVEKADNKYINQLASLIDSSVFLTKYFGGADLKYGFTKTNNLIYPTKGINFTAGSEWLINLKEGKRSFVNVQSSFTFYYSPFKKVTLAHRTGVAINIGDYEFYQASTVGGNENLRGYWRTRFSGSSSFYQNTDIRLKIADIKGYVFRGVIGIYGFFDDGRVWLKNEQLKTIHIDYGGGIYILPYNMLALNISYGMSKEANVFTISTGFLF